MLESGDTLLFAVDANGRLLANARGLPVPGLPDPAGVAAALAGGVDAREHQDRRRDDPGLHRAGPQRRRHRRRHPSRAQRPGASGGAATGRRDEPAGVGLGAIVAVPVGLFLAHRAMRPIDATFARQRAFVADASHELRTPLTLIRATTELVQRLPDASPAVREELGGVLDEVDATGRLVDDLLLLARLDSDELPLRLHTWISGRWSAPRPRHLRHWPSPRGCP